MRVESSNLDRREAVSALLGKRGGAFVITGLGSPSYDVHSLGDHERNYYLWGAMGSAALVGLGLAQARPQERVIVVTGDGEQLMGLGGLATIGVAAPKNLIVVVIDNGHFGETGMQISHTGCGLSIADVAKACGFVRAETVATLADVDDIDISSSRPLEGPELYVIKVKAENLPRSLPPRDAVHVKNRFRATLGLSTA